MKNNPRNKGRPQLAGGKKTKKIDVRFTEEEFQQIQQLELSLGFSRTQLIRLRLLEGTTQILYNSREMISLLDQIGTELARSGNNINQLAHHANTLRKRGLIAEEIAEKFNVLLDKHVNLQLKLEETFRKIIRLLRG